MRARVSAKLLNVGVEEPAQLIPLLWQHDEQCVRAARGQPEEVKRSILHAAGKLGIAHAADGWTCEGEMQYMIATLGRNGMNHLK